MSDHITTVIRLTDLQQLDAEDKWVEVINGEIVAGERDVTFLHVVIIDNLYDLLKPFAKAHKLGRVQTDGVRFVLAGTLEDIKRARKPDFSFIRAGRIPADFDWAGDFLGAPDLAVEVASPGQSNPVLLDKITDYLTAGTEEAWLIFPWRKEVYQYRRDEEVPRIYRSGDVINTSALFPGLKLMVDELFVTSDK